MLESLENNEIEVLRQRLERDGCVFDFTLCRVTEQAALGEATHRQALAGLFERINSRMLKHQADVVAKHPHYASYQWPELTVNLTDARPLKLSQNKVVELTEAGGALERAFLDPPYKARLTVADFREWLAVLRLLPGEDVEVYDWVGNPDEEPERSNWSSYFDEGKDWWGIWCLTAYNPQRGTLCALAASTSD